jgi:hypothetical protein
LRRRKLPTPSSPEPNRIREDDSGAVETSIFELSAVPVKVPFGLIWNTITKLLNVPLAGNCRLGNSAVIDELVLDTEMLPTISHVEPLICVTVTGPTNTAETRAVAPPTWPGTVPITDIIPPPPNVNEEDVWDVREPVLNCNHPQDDPPQDRPETASEGPPASPT